MLIETPRRLSLSGIWDRNQAFYEDLGPRAWRERGIPSYITSNAALARAYADVIFTFAREVGRPVTVLELGAGHGQLTFLLHRALARVRQESQLQAPPIEVVFTDVVEDNLKEAQAHPFLEGVRVRRVDCRNPEPLDHDGPVVIVANYLLDTLPADAFRVETGVLSELRAGLRDRSTDDDGVLDRTGLFWEAEEAPRPYYDDPALDGVLAHYRTLGDATFLVPTVGSRCLDTLTSRASEALVLIGDKGFATDLEHKGLWEPHFAEHGSTSVMVNFDALARIWPGEALVGRDHSSDLVMCGLLKGKLPSTRWAWKRALDHVTPVDNFRVVFMLDLGKDVDVDVDGIMAFLRLGDWDPRLFVHAAPRLARIARVAIPEQRRQIERILDRVAERFFPLSDDYDSLYGTGRIRAALGQHVTAIGCYQESERWFGARAAIDDALSRSYAALGDAEQAAHHRQLCYRRTMLDEILEDADQATAVLDAMALAVYADMKKDADEELEAALLLRDIDLPIDDAEAELDAALQRVQRMDPGDIEDVVADIVKRLPSEALPKVYELVLSIVWGNGEFNRDEDEVVAIIEQAFGLDTDTIAAIEAEVTKDM